MAQSKADTRKHFMELRTSLGQAERDRIDAGITAQVLSSAMYRQAKIVLAYLSFGAEVDTREIIRNAWADGKTVALPRCIPGRRMAWHVVRSFEGLVHSKFGVDEPADDPATQIDPNQPNALTLVPGLTFDLRGFRMGYGGGFYDVFLANFPGSSLGLCRECQLSETVPCLDAHDLPVQAIATEKRLIRCEEQ